MTELKKPRCKDRNIVRKTNTLLSLLTVTKSFCFYLTTSFIVFCTRIVFIAFNTIRIGDKERLKYFYVICKTRLFISTRQKKTSVSSLPAHLVTHRALLQILQSNILVNEYSVVF